MGSSNRTNNYDLPQFADNDKPSWRGDINGAMAKIDQALSGIQVNLNTTSSAIEGKADESNVYTKTAIDNLLTAKATVEQLSAKIDSDNVDTFTATLIADTESNVRAALDSLFANNSLVTGAIDAANAASAAVQGLTAQQEALETTAATVGELVQTVRIGVEGGSVASNSVNPIWIAPFSCRIESFSLLSSTYSRAADPTVYHEFALRTNVATTNAFIVSKRTSAETIAAQKPWDFAGSSNWNEANRVLSAGDALFLNILFNGGAGPVPLPIVGVFRYAPA